MVISENIQETLLNKKIELSDILNIHDIDYHKIKGVKTVIITGVTGQDGSFMADYLLKHTDYQIFGGVRRLSVQNHDNIHHVNTPRFKLVNFDLTDSHAISRIVENIKPDYFINYAAQSFVAASWDFARQTWETNTTAVLDILESIRLYAPNCRFYNAGSSEEFGNVIYSPQDENHPLRPRSPYAASKSAARQLVKVYRESYNLFAVQGWLFNHEGTRRGAEFVSRKITKGVSRIYRLLHHPTDEERGRSIPPIELGNLNAKRDWSDSEDFVDAVWKMLCNDVPTDYVVASGETHSIREFVELAFKAVGISGEWIGEGEDEKYVMVSSNNDDGGQLSPKSNNELVLVKINPQFYRPAEVDVLVGNSGRIRSELGWSPTTNFKDLVFKMVKNDILSVSK